MGFMARLFKRRPTERERRAREQFAKNPWLLECSGVGVCILLAEANDKELSRQWHNNLFADMPEYQIGPR